MSSPRRRPRDPRYRPKSAARAIAPSRPDPFIFDGISDTPAGVVLRQEPHATVAVVPTRQWGISLLFFFLTCLVGLGLATSISNRVEEQLPFSFLVFLAVVLLGLLAFALFHFFGYVRLEVREGHFYHFRGAWAWAWRVRCPLRASRAWAPRRSGSATGPSSGLRA